MDRRNFYQVKAFATVKIEKSQFKVSELFDQRSTFQSNSFSQIAIKVIQLEHLKTNFKHQNMLFQLV